jgi:uncharacterized protein
MKLTTYDSAESFLSRVEPMLERREAANNVPLGLAHAIKDHPERFGKPYLWSVDDEAGNVKTVVFWTPPFNLLLVTEQLDEDELTLVVQSFIDQGLRPVGVTGTVEVAHAFADIWTRLTGQTSSTTVQMRAFELRQVKPPLNVAGEMVEATVEDHELLVDWYGGFYVDAMPHVPMTRDDLSKSVDSYLRPGMTYLWKVDGQPTAMAVRSRETRHGAVISLVYTPPEQRGHGYASALVAALSQHILDSGKEFAALFTNIDNPTSNKIYQQIGYQPVADVNQLTFEG